MAERVKQGTIARTSARQREEARRASRTATMQPGIEQEVQINAAVSIGLKHRITVYGMTGTGKTTWVRQLLPRMRAWFGLIGINIIDSKGYHEYDDMATRLHVGPDAPEPAKPGEIVVWVIPGKPDPAQLDAFLNSILATGKPCITLADEITNFRRNSTTFVDGLDTMLKQGRFAGIMLIAMTQEFAGNTRNLFGQTTHVLRFHLLNPYDGRELNKVMGVPAQPGQPPAEPPLPYGFFYRRVDRPSPVYSYAGWQEFFRF